jgi:hypothetical protein
MTAFADRFSAPVLIAEARKRSGLDHFGGEQFRDALGPFLESLHRQEAQFSEIGRIMLFEELVGGLEKRLRIEDYFRRHPDAMDETISRPVFITGLYRSGTSKLLGLIAADPRFQFLANWKTVSPAPIGPHVPGEPDPRIEKAEKSLALLRERSPHAAAAHPLTALSPSEEVALMMSSYRAVDAKHLRTGFNDWVLGQDNGPMYRDLHRVLKVLQHQFRIPGLGEQRYVLKAPVHLGNLDWLLREFPDARVIVTHRDPFDAVHSFTMVRESLRGMYCDHIDPLDMGTEIIEQASGALERSVESRARLPSGSLFELPFTDIVRRMPDRLEELYAFIGADLTDGVRDALAREEAHGAQHKSRAERKDPATYGLTRERVYAAMPDYLAFVRESQGIVW